LIAESYILYGAIAFSVVVPIVAGFVLRASRALQVRARAEAETATTRMKRAEVRATVAEQSRTELLALMDREVRGPLNSVVGSLGLLDDMPLSNEARGYLDQARRHGDAALWSVDDVLDAARLDAGTLVREDMPLDIVDLADGVARSIAGRVVGRDVAVAVAYGPGVPRQVVSDRYLLRRVLTLLLGHAALHTEQAGVVLHLFLVGEASGKTTVRFELRQVGGGGDPSAWFNKFPEFAQSVFKGLAAKLGGSFESDPILAKDGSLRLAVPFGTLAERRGPATSAGSVVGVKLLVVDHHPGRRAMLRKQLEPFGVMVVEAADAPSALDCIELAKLSGRAYDAAVIAEMMPVIDGATLARRIRDLPEAAPMRLIATGAAARLGTPSATFDVYLATPVGQQALHAALAPVAHGHAMMPVLEAVPATPAPGTRQFRVLLIERNPVHQMLASMMLSREGHAVDVASSGTEAVSLARAVPHDVVLIDLLLADGDGKTIGRRLRGEMGNDLTAPVIAMAEPNAPRALAEEIAVGVVDIIAKPIDKNQLFSAIARAVPPLPAPAPEPEPEVDVAALRDLAAQLDALKSAVTGDDGRETA
jgi:two-component system, sensor histidine kinase and response regulator